MAPKIAFLVQIHLLTNKKRHDLSKKQLSIDIVPDFCLYAKLQHP
jgi:hypothetical protein